MDTVAAERDDSIRGSNDVTGLRVRRTARPQESRRRHLGTGGLSTQNLCQVESMPHDVNTNTATQDTTTVPTALQA